MGFLLLTLGEVPLSVQETGGPVEGKVLSTN